jgi:hypothetical protein
MDDRDDLHSVRSLFIKYDVASMLVSLGALRELVGPPSHARIGGEESETSFQAVFIALGLEGPEI